MRPRPDGKLHAFNLIDMNFHVNISKKQSRSHTLLRRYPHAGVTTDNGMLLTRQLEVTHNTEWIFKKASLFGQQCILLLWRRSDEPQVLPCHQFPHALCNIRIARDIE